MRFLVLLLALVLPLAGWAEIKLIKSVTHHIPDTGYSIEVLVFEDIEEFVRVLVRNDQQQIVLDKELSQAPATSDWRIFKDSFGRNIVYMDVVGGSGGGAGLYRYRVGSKELDYFAGDYKKGFPSFNEIYKYEDINSDGLPELFATSRQYGERHFVYYWTVYEWPWSNNKPRIGKGPAFEELYKKLATEYADALEKTKDDVMDAALEVMARHTIRANDSDFACVVQSTINAELRAKIIVPVENSYHHTLMAIQCH